MNSYVLRIGLVAALALSANGSAQAQIAPNDTGAGERRGAEALSQSGEVGTITLFRRGPNATLVVLDVEQAPNHPQPASLQRARGCDRIQPQVAFRLNNVVHGHSATVVPASEARLLSGNYSALVHGFAAGRTSYVTCGHLY